MAKKISALALVFLAAGFVFAQDAVSPLEISGEMKTGFYWEQVGEDGKLASEDAKMHNNDDAGPNEGRFRLNLHLHKDNNMGMKVRFEQVAWGNSQPPQWAYAMAYGNFLEEQLRVTIGKLGESPWSAGGPDIWDELDNKVGIRAEIMPIAVPGLDAGFVLGEYNEAKYRADDKNINKLADILQETVFGVAYTNDVFHGRFSWRLDGRVDNISFSTYNPGLYVDDNMSMMYRLEERIIRQYLPGFSVWLNGYWKGIGEDPDLDYRDSTYSYKNWLYIDYSPDDFSSRLSLGLDFTKNLATFNGRAAFYYNIFSFLSAGAAVKYRQDFGEDAKDQPFVRWGLEPQARVTFNPNAYVALVYSYEQVNATDGLKQVLQEFHWVNLRVVYTF